MRNFNYIKLTSITRAISAKANRVIGVYNIYKLTS